MTNKKIYPLTLPQQAFYYDYLLFRNDSKYNMGGLLILDGELDIDLYRKANNYVILKYDALRLRFTTNEGELFQYIVPEYECDIKHIDFRDRKNPLDEALRFIAEENAKPFHFEDVDLHRQVILQTGDRQFICFPRFHHMANDGYGHSVLTNAVSVTYNSLLEEGHFPEIESRSYLDFLEDDLKYRLSNAFKDSSEYWRKKLTPLPDPLDFTSRKQRVRNFSLHNERVTLNLHRICYAALLKIADEVGVTTFQALLGILYTTLLKLYNKSDIVIGMPVLNRSNHKFRRTPGLFLNMIPLRLHLSVDWTFTDILNAIKAEVKECYRHQRLPLSEMLRNLRNTPEFNNELFDVTIVYRKLEFSQRFGSANLKAITLGTQLRNESFGLEVDEYDDEGNVNIFFNYNPLVLSEQEVTQFARCFEAVLYELIYFPEKSIANVQFLSVFEQHKIIQVFNKAGNIERTDKTIVSTFGKCIRTFPNEISIVDNEKSWTYNELDRKSNQIANALIDQNCISKGDIVCLAAERSMETIAVMIGIMKTGAVCLPIDSHNPRQRIAFILKDSGAKFFITDQAEYKNLPAKVQLLSEIESSNRENPSADIHPGDLAYIIYTSGSTGTPKGVMIEHGSFMNMFVNMIGNFGVTHRDHVLQFASLGFDAAVFEIFQALLTGAVLVIAGKETIQDPESFIRYMDEKKVTVATIPPAYLSALDKPEFPYLHTLITAGEQALVSDVNHYRKFKKVINAYGPTEAAVCASYYRVEKDMEYTGYVPIGKTVPGSSIYILNDRLELLPVGFTGELCISGPNLARGYLNNASLTEEKFVPNPFDKNRRMYRTGDMARWLPDGTIEFIGRMDNQVKIRGNRIELGEIESRLQHHSQIKDAIILDVELNETKDIAAFILSNQKLDSVVLKKYLLDFLPEYMVPQYFYFLDKFPLTQNGKVNKNELRKMVSVRDTSTRDDSLETNEMERKLIPIVENVLNCHPIGVQDNFFELGGDSLRIARLITRIKKELQLEINFKTIFDHPTVKGVSTELMRCSMGQFDDIRPAAVQDHYPLSHAQRRLWILAQDKGNAAVYNMPVSLLLEGNLNTDYLKKAINAVVKRHEILRTIFVEFEGTPVQKILTTYGNVITEYDFSLENNAAAKAKAVINEEVMTSFELSREIPFRAHIVKINKEKQVLLLLIHHIAGDGISVGIIMNELSQLYHSFITGDHDHTLNPLQLEYKDYCVHEQNLLESYKYRKEKEYWLNTLCRPVPVLNLPTDRMRPAIKTYGGKYLFSEVGQSLTYKLKQFAITKNVSPFMVLLASVKILLHKYTSNEDIIVGSPVSGRNHQELEGQVGVYINTIALRNQINGDQTFMDFLQNIRTNAAEAFSNSSYPFDELIQHLNLDRDTSHAPLFDVLVQYQNQDVTTFNLKDVKSSFYPVDFTASKFDLTFTFTGSDDKIGFSIGYNTMLFHPDRIERSATHLLNIISSTLNVPNICIKDIDILDHTEAMTLRKMSEGPDIRLEEKTVINLFEKQLENTPDHLALVFNDTKLTYRKLDHRANAVANAILKNNLVRPDDIIAIMAHHSEMMVIGILGILKTGAAYLPISPDLPQERIKFMLLDSQSKLLLTESSLMKQAGEIVRLTPADLTLMDLNNIDAPSFQPPVVTTVPSNLAYVIYTSGSTGTPKGVMIEHHSLHNLVLGLSDGIYGTTSAPLNIALISPFVFDASVKQLFYALLNGHCLDIIPDEIKLDGRKLLEYYQTHQIDVSDGTPVHLEIILDELNPDTVCYLPSRLVIGGQQLMAASVQKLFDLAGDHSPVVTNVYGPTECCDVSTCMSFTPEQVSKTGTGFVAMPIGKPLNNVQVYILDAHRKPVPAGINGELCIAGEGLARGYVNRPELTEEKFMKVDFVQNGRIYQSGDIGRYLEDGTILLTGRADDQIKLRGFRIELSEIENGILNYNVAVQSAVVVLAGNENDQEIAAYYTASEKMEKDDLRQFLSVRLPAYMIPSYFIQLEKLPLTINGKVDKKSLPAPVKGTVPEGDTSLPADIIEARLCEIWKELLHLGRVSCTDNFFKLGGHSLIAIRMVSRIHKEFNMEVNIWEVFQYSTVTALAKLLKSKNPSLYSPIERLEERDCYSLSHSQRRLWLLSRLEGQNALYNLPAALHLKGDLDVLALEKAFQAIVQRHESFRTYFVELDGEPFQKIADRVDFHIEQTEYSGGKWDYQKLHELALDFFQIEFDLSQLPLLKIKLIRVSDDHYLLLFNMHHIISDGWSIEIILKEFEINYNAYFNHLEPFHQPLRIQYKDYASWQNKMLEEASLAPIKDYWHRKLGKPRSLLNLPADYPRSDTLSLDGNLLHYSLDEAKTKALMEIGGGRNASLYMTLLTVVYILLYKYTGEEDIMVGSPVAGRQHFDLENQIGFFINTLVLRNEVCPEYSFLDLLGKVNKTLTDAFDNQIYPFDKLVDELDVERIRNRNPLFDVMVAWMVKNGMTMKMNFNGIEAEGLEFNITKSMFDLTFLFEEDGKEVRYGIEYSTSMFSKERIQRMSEHFKQLVDNILAAPKEKIRNLTILPDQEKEQLLHEFNETGQSLKPEKNAIQLFNEQVQIHQNDIVLVFDNQKLTYSKLDQLSNRIANLLIETVDPGKEDIITVIVEDPVLSVAAVLGVMKTGAAYLPVMPNTPAERISYIIRDSRSKAVLVDGYSSEFETGTYLDLRSNLSQNISFPERKIECGDLAYVIYTSGSTGTPKGVMIEHGSLTNLITSLNRSIYSHYPAQINELMISSFAFDVSLKQIFAVLCHGNTLHLLSHEKRLDPREIMKYILQNKINIIDLTPSVFSVMLEEGFRETNKPYLKELFLGSEALPYKLVRNFYGNAENKTVQITNFYGPTECCVESSFFRFDRDLMNEDTDIAPIGKPTLNQQIYVLDPYLNLCPVGVPGEICIAGKGLARQYLNDPERTNEKFVTFPQLGGVRIYKTGDSGRIRSDGNIEFLGRMDEQVKIRGYRVELQEIEKHLRDVDSISECAVTLFEKDGSGELAAYFTSDKTVEQNKLRNHLERFLPKYMIPSCFVQLEKIPLSANGKVDKRHLPDPSGIQGKATFRAPEDEIELLVIRVCSEVLKKETISLGDNFFEIGGNSLNAVRIISRIQKELDISLALKDIFYNPVLLDISEIVKKAMNISVLEVKADETTTVIAPASDEELKLLLEMQFDDEDE